VPSPYARRLWRLVPEHLRRRHRALATRLRRTRPPVPARPGPFAQALTLTFRGLIRRFPLTSASWLRPGYRWGTTLASSRGWDTRTPRYARRQLSHRSIAALKSTQGGSAPVCQTPGALSTVLQSRASLLTVITWLVSICVCGCPWTDLKFGRSGLVRCSWWREPGGAGIRHGARGMLRGALGEWVCVPLPLPGGRPAGLSCRPTAARAGCAGCGNGVTVPGWAVG
jgi:hypothetical protein